MYNIGSHLSFGECECVLVCFPFALMHIWYGHTNKHIQDSGKGANRNKNKSSWRVVTQDVDRLMGTMLIRDAPNLMDGMVLHGQRVFMGVCVCCDQWNREDAFLCIFLSLCIGMLGVGKPLRLYGANVLE